MVKGVMFNQKKIGIQQAKMVISHDLTATTQNQDVNG